MNALAGTPGAQCSGLERLPSELLILVFDRVWTETETKQLSPIPKTLRPFLLRNQYRDIKIDYYHFLRLCNTIHDSHALIQKIVITSWRVIGDSDWLGDYEVEHEKAIFDFCKAATSLERFEGLDDHPRLQQRILSAKFALHCFKSIRSFDLRFPGNEEYKNSALSKQTRYLAYFPKLDRIAIEFFGGRKGRFSSAEEEEKFEEEDREEIKLAEFVHREWNTISTLSMRGKVFPDGLDVFAAGFRQLQSLMLKTFHMGLAQVLLNSIEPSTVKKLIWDTEFGSYQEVKGSLDKFVSLESLTITGFTIEETLIASLSKLRQLTKVRVIDISPSPLPSEVLLLLDPLTRPPELQSLHVRPPCYFNVSVPRQLHPITSYDPTEHGLVRPFWAEDWTVQLAREIVSLAAQEGIRLGGAKDWAKSIAITEAYLETRGDASDSDEDGSNASETGSEGEEGSGSEDGF